MQGYSFPRSWLRPLLLGGVIVALISLLLDWRGLVKTKNHRELCQKIIQPQAVLSREQLAKLLTIPERDKKTRCRRLSKRLTANCPT